MLVRVEIPVDAAGIDQLLRSAFQRSDEAELVQQLRQDGLLTLGMVVTDDEGGVIGYAAFSPVDIAGEDRQWVALGPLAVAVEQRCQGLAQQLVYAGLDALNEFGYQVVVVVGDPAYYQRLGFIPAAQHQVYCRWPDTAATFQLYPLAAAALDGVQGAVIYSAPFDRF